jgi:hypothetical protein
MKRLTLHRFIASVAQLWSQPTGAIVAEIPRHAQEFHNSGWAVLCIPMQGRGLGYEDVYTYVVAVTELMAYIVVYLRRHLQVYMIIYMCCFY